MKMQDLHFTLLIFLFVLIAGFSLDAFSFGGRPVKTSPRFTATEIGSTAAIQNPDALYGMYNGQSCKNPTDSFRCMLCNCMWEAGNEPLAGKEMVGMVVKSRVDDARWPDSICGVIYQPKQFSWANTMDGRKSLPNTLTQSFQECIQATKNTINKPGNGIDHYHATYVRPKWASTCQKVKQIGAHIFYDHCDSERGPHRRYRNGKSTKRGNARRTVK